MKAMVYEIVYDGWYGPYVTKEIFIPIYNLAFANADDGKNIAIEMTNIDKYKDCISCEHIEIPNVEALRVLEIYEMNNKILQISKTIKDNFSNNYLKPKMEYVTCDNCKLTTLININLSDRKCRFCKTGTFKIKEKNNDTTN